MAEDKTENLAFYQRPMVILGVLLSIPLVLAFAGTAIVANSGPPPGGTTTTCERFSTDELGFRITFYTFTSGLTRYDQQTFAVTRDGGTSWVDVFEGLVIAPMVTTCDEQVVLVTDEASALWNRNTVAVTQDAGETWMVHNVCDTLPAETEDCDDEILDFVAVSFDDAQNGVITVREFAVDSLGERLLEEGSPIINNRYDLQTGDGGLTWQISNY